MRDILGVHEMWMAAMCIFVSILYFCARRGKNLPPGPHGLPFIGYVPFLGKHPPTTYANLSKQYGPVISVRLGTGLVVILNDYDTIHEALVKKGDVFSGRPQLYLLNRITEGFGIIFRDFDAQFKSQRKFALATLRGFGVGKRSMEDRITEEIEYFSDLIQSKNGKSFNCQSALSTSVSNVICSVVMGSRFSYNDEVFQSMVAKLNQGFSDKKEAVFVTLMTFAPALRILPLFSGVYKAFMNDIQFILNVIREIISEHEKTLDIRNPRDYIDEFLCEMRRGGDKDLSFKDIQLLQTIRDFFLAGTETTSSTLRWCVLLFAHRPDVQEKICREIKKVIGESVPSMKFKDEMPFVAAFLHEMTRHRTLIPMAVPHMTTDAVHFKGYHIPKNITVLPNIWAVHHDPTHFKNPEEFRPERFIDENGKFVPSKYVIPFGIGPRYCLGEQLAKMELFLFLTNILQRFEIVSDPEKPLPDFDSSVTSFTDVPHHFEVCFKPRT